MPRKLVFSNANDVSTMMKYKKGTTDFDQQLKETNMGTCAAQSALWLKNLKSSRILLSKPDSARAQLIFSRCWMNKSNIDPDRFNKSIMQTAGVNPGGRTTKSGSSAFSHIAANPGYYYIDLNGHVVAAAYIAPNSYYFFDPNHGCWEYNKASDFTSDSNSTLAQDGWIGDWWLYKVTL
jgi:hypothetical protein